MSCYNCGKAGDALLKCSRCKTATYCSKRCQKQHWKSHKKACKVSSAWRSLHEATAVGGPEGMSIEQARAELEEAMRLVEKLQRDADDAKENLAREKREERELEEAASVSAGAAEAAAEAAAAAALHAEAPDYGSSDYWEEAYKSKTKYRTEGADSYDWYFNDYERVHPLFVSLFGSRESAGASLHPSSVVVDVGCGNSPLLSNLLKTSVIASGVGIDASPAVINDCKRAAPSAKLTFFCHDLSQPVPGGIVKDNSLDGAIDKGTLDAILSSGNDTASSQSAIKTATMVILNVMDLLVAGGKFVVFTNLPPDMALDFFSSVCQDVACLAAFEPNGSESVRLGSGLGE